MRNKSKGRRIKKKNQGLSSFTCHEGSSSTTSELREVSADGLWIKHRLREQSDRHRRACTPPCFPKVGIYGASPLLHIPLTLSLQSKISLELDASVSWRSGSRTAGESEASETGERFNNKVQLNAWLILTHDREAPQTRRMARLHAGVPRWGARILNWTGPPGGNGPCEFQSKLKGLRMSWDFVKKVLHERCRDSEQLSGFSTETEYVSPEDTTMLRESQSITRKRPRSS